MNLGKLHFIVLTGLSVRLLRKPARTNAVTAATE